MITIKYRKGISRRHVAYVKELLDYEPPAVLGEVWQHIKGWKAELNKSIGEHDGGFWEDRASASRYLLDVYLNIYPEAVFWLYQNKRIPRVELHQILPKNWSWATVKDALEGKVKGVPLTQRTAYTIILPKKEEP